MSIHPTKAGARVAGVILAGGRSARFGASKAAAMLGGKTLIQHVADALAPGCASLAVAGPSDGLPAGFQRIEDGASSVPGPLSGVLAAMEWAASAGADWVVTAPCDTPLLPYGVPQRLVNAALSASTAAAIASGPDGPHPLIGAWRTSLATHLRERLRDAHPPARAVAADLGAIRVPLPSWSVININTPGDLSLAQTTTFAGGALGTDARIFDFEADFARTLRCIPMCVRARLDRAGVKLTLRQWSRLSVDDRHALARLACDTPVEIAAWRSALLTLASPHPDPDMKDLDVDEAPIWADVSRIPDPVAALAAERGQPALTTGGWAALAPIQRFALMKLTRDAHENENFVPALSEFRLSLGVDASTGTQRR